jgi:hypothetical protein
VSANLAASGFYRIELNDELPDQMQLLQLTGVELTSRGRPSIDSPDSECQHPIDRKASESRR